MKKFTFILSESISICLAGRQSGTGNIYFQIRVNLGNSHNRLMTQVLMREFLANGDDKNFQKDVKPELPQNLIL